MTRATLGPPHGAYHDIDACPTLDFLVSNRDHPEYSRYFEMAVGLRPAEELFDIRVDPACLQNLASSPEHESVRRDLATQLQSYLQATGDPRVTADGSIWETYPRVSKLRWFPPPAWAREANGEVASRGWLDPRRPRE